jgi:toxin FitB
MISSARSRIATLAKEVGADGAGVVADTSVWVAWLTEAAGADRYAALFEAAHTRMIVPTITIYEVNRWYLARNRKDEAQLVTSVMAALPVIELTASLASTAASLARQHQLAMADSIILASARSLEAELWTQDKDFAGLPDVRLFERL